MALIKPFNQLGKNDAATAGGKGASLGEMTQAGIPVPPGFVILADAFERFITETDLTAEIDSILSKVNHQEMHTIEHASETIQGLILNVEMPADLRKEIQKSFKDLNTEFVAIRSSATAEDGAQAAWAGQLDTFLNTTEETLLENVRECWASLFTPRAIFYRFEKGMNLQKISVAVVVQKMVQSDAAGIAFSVHPVTEDHNQMIIEAGFGLGEAVVSGQVTPDSYVVTKSPRAIIDKNISKQSQGLYRKAGGGNAWKDLSKEKGASQVLTDEQILTISEVLVTIENHYGFPVDTEWAMEDDHLYVVQSRPITTLSNNDKARSSGDIPPGTSKWLSHTDYLLTFEGRGLRILLTEIVSTGYLPRESLVFYQDETYKQFYSLKYIAEMGELGKVFFADPEATQKTIRALEDEFKNTPAYFKKFRSNESISESDITELFATFTSMNMLYGKFDFAYTDAAYEFLSDNPIVKKNLDLVESHKNQLREEYNKLLFEPDCLFALLLNKLSAQFSVLVEDLQWYLSRDLLNLYTTGPLQEEILKGRKRGVIFQNVSHSSKLEFTEGEEAVRRIEQFGANIIEATDTLKGVTANSTGKVVRGTVFSLDTNYGDFEELKKQMSLMKKGQILVAPTTAPEHMDAIRKAAAMVVDVGGLLSHTAIVGRELGIPSIVGTQYASKILKNGDEVEVDAEAGIVRILEKSKSLRAGDYQKLFQWPGEFSYFLSSYFMAVYNKHEALSFHDGAIWQSFLPLDQKERTLSEGVQIYSSIEHYTELTDGLLNGFDDLTERLDAVLKSARLEKGDVADFFKRAITHYNYYSQTEFFYTDRAYEQREQYPDIQTNFKTFDDLKLKGREYLNKIALAPGCYLDQLLEKIGNQHGLNLEILKRYSLDEVISLMDGKQVAEDILSLRGIYFMQGKKDYTAITVGPAASDAIQKFLSDIDTANLLKGQTANKGLYTGRARVFRFSIGDIHSMHSEIEKMVAGEILVADTTAPEIILACKKAGAIVTNQGGMMSHAAIIARELDIPCVVGTGYATEIIQTGDQIEVDAGAGLVRIIKN